jgi:hypothetical protein
VVGEPPPLPAAERTSVLLSDGERSIRLQRPRRPLVGQAIAVELDLFGADGEPLRPQAVALTVTAPDGARLALSAATTSLAGRYRAAFRVSRAGAYVLAIASAEDEATVEHPLTVEVAEAPPAAPPDHDAPAA